MTAYKHDLLFYQSGLPTLRERGIAAIALGRPPEADQHYSLGEALVVSVGLLLEKIGRLSADQRELILRDARQALLEHVPAAHPQFLLVFLDDTRATWTHRRGYLDLKTGETYDQPPVPHLVSVAYNISELWRRTAARHDALLANRKGATDGHSSPEADRESGVGGPGLVCDDAPDPGG